MDRPARSAGGLFYSGSLVSVAAALVCAAVCAQRPPECAASSALLSQKLRVLPPFDLGHVHQPQVSLIDQGGCLSVLPCARSSYIGEPCATIRDIPARTRFASRLRAASSRPLHAFINVAISAADPSMDQRVLPAGKKKYRTVTEFAEAFRLYGRRENKAPRRSSFKRIRRLHQ